MFPTNETFHLTIGMAWTKKIYHEIIVAADTALQISCTLVTRPIPRRPRRSAQLIGAAVDAAVDAVADSNVAARIGAMIIRTGIEMIMEMVFKRGATIRFAITVVKSLDRILPTLLDFMLIGSMILALLPCHMTMTIGICQGILMILQP